MFDAIYGLAHPGIRTTRKMVAKRFVWHGMNKQISTWAQTCLRSKVQRQVRAPLEHGQLPEPRFQRIHMDIVGPLPSSQGMAISSRSLTTTQGGQRLSPWSMPLPPCLPGPSYTTTSPSLEYPPTSHLIGDHNSPRLYRQPCGLYWVHSCTTPLPTTRKQMALSSDYTGG